VNPFRGLRSLAVPILLLGWPAPTPADEPGPKAADPEAGRLLGEVAKAYRALESYADEGTFTVSVSIDDQARERTSPFRVRFSRPNKIDLEAGDTRLLSDGKSLTSVVGPLKTYEVRPAPAALRLDSFVDRPVGAFLFGGPLGNPLPTLVALLLEEDAATAILARSGGRPRIGADGEWKGKAVRSLVIDLEKGPDLRLLIDPETKLAVRIEQVIDPDSIAGHAPKGVTLKAPQVAWTAGTISTEAPKPEAFAFAPPQGFSQIGARAERREVADAKKKDEPVNDLVGKPAPAFTLTMLDGEGKTKKVSKDDLEGKVVLIDFWATWCGPCRKELPEIQKLIEDLDRKGNPDVLVIALSLDQKPSDLPGVRKLVESSLKEMGVDLTAGKVGKIALDPTGALGEAFGVDSIPSIAILDRKGIVRSFRVGYDDEIDLRAALAKEIDELLDPAAEKAQGGEKGPE
jgi:thiol-disulfide isomerase/thioredoxin